MDADLVASMMWRYFLYLSGVRTTPIGVDKPPLLAIKENINEKLTESTREQEYQACGGCRGYRKAEDNHCGSRRIAKSARNLEFPKVVGEKNGKRHRCRPQMEKPRG